MSYLTSANLPNLFIIAFMGAVLFAVLRRITNNNIIPIIIGLLMLFIGGGGLFSIIGATTAAIGISRAAAKTVESITIS